MCTKYIVNNLIKNTQETLMGYLEKTAETRHPETGVGSVCTHFRGAKIRKNQNLLWLLGGVDDWEIYHSQNIMEGCKALKTEQLTGKLGVIPLKELPEETILTMEDPKNTGFPTPVVEGDYETPANFTILIYGEHEGKDVIYTFHPGEPITPAQIKTELSEMTVKKAISMGFTHAKIKQK